MANYICPKCVANNPEPGQCVMCRGSLGSFQRAIVAGTVAAFAMGGLWIVMSLFLNIQIPLVAGIFGGVVAGCTSHFSGGRGILFQFIATFLTIVGILTADTIVVLMLEGRSVGLESVWEDMGYRILNDPITIFFYSIGVITSFFIWR